MEPDSSMRISEIVKEISGERFVYSVLSGPSFAKEVAATKSDCRSNR